jgi:hypothetical protein
VTTPAYTPRLRERRRLELSLAEDARQRTWPREAERHCTIALRIEQLLSDLGEEAARSLLNFELSRCAWITVFTTAR